jgi:hypothetical protein
VIVLRIEFSFEDYIIDDWLEVNGYPNEDFADYMTDFVDEYFATTPDNVEML